MSGTSSIYGWQGGRRSPPPKPEMSKRKRAELVNQSGKMLFEARKAAYARYCKECRAWGGDPAEEENWFMHAKMEYCRLVRGEKHKSAMAEKEDSENARDRRVRLLRKEQ